MSDRHSFTASNSSHATPSSSFYGHDYLNMQNPQYSFTGHDTRLNQTSSTASHRPYVTSASSPSGYGGYDSEMQKHPSDSPRHSTQSNKTRNTPASCASQNRYSCLWPNCEFTAARAFDLGRHVNTHTPETARRLDCPYARNGFCGRMGERGFTREDHRNEHIRKVHPRPR